MKCSIRSASWLVALLVCVFFSSGSAFAQDARCVANCDVCMDNGCAEAGGECHQLPGSTACSCNIGAPAIQEWGATTAPLFALALAGALLARRRTRSILPMDGRLLAKTTAVTTMLASLGLVAANRIFVGGMRFGDVVGALLASTVLAYVVHLWTRRPSAEALPA